MFRKLTIIAAGAALAMLHSAHAQPSGAQPAQKGAAVRLADPAAAFGARESVEFIRMSPDGRRVAYVAPGRGQGSPSHG